MIKTKLMRINPTASATLSINSESMRETSSSSRLGTFETHDSLSTNLKFQNERHLSVVVRMRENYVQVFVNKRHLENMMAEHYLQWRAVEASKPQTKKR